MLKTQTAAVGLGLILAWLAPGAGAQQKAAVAAEAPQAAVFPVTVLHARPRPHDARLRQILSSPSPARIKALDNTLIGFGTRVSTSDYHPGGPDDPGSTTESTATRGVVPARKWIASQFEQISRETGGRLQVRIDTFKVPKQRRVPEDQTMSNVVATLPGTDPNDKRIFVVSGHYDSIPADFKLDAPGANDDASGTIISMESARALARYQFPATIEFMAVEGEEQGLLGSKYEADTDKAKGLDIAAMLNDDMDGGDQTPGYENRNVVRVYSQGVPANATPEELRFIAANAFENDSPSREVARFAAEVAGMYLPHFEVLLEFRPDRFQRGGDHESFVNAGYPAVRFSEFRENSNHQHVPLSVNAAGVEMGDRGQWISPTYIANEVRVNALTLASLAASPLPPEHVYFQGGQQIGTKVDWSPVAGAAGYRLLLRATASPNWTLRIAAPPVPAPPPAPRAGAPAPETPAGPMYQITIPQSPDNYIIAVVSVDKDGHESLPRLGTARPFRRPAPAAGRGGH